MLNAPTHLSHFHPKFLLLEETLTDDKYCIVYVCMCTCIHMDSPACRRAHTAYIIITRQGNKSVENLSAKLS